MKNSPSIASLRRWLSRLGPNPARDADLIHRFAEFRDESAFAALLDLHGPMVLGVARRIVGDHHLAEDVFQATFLVLARSAGRIRRPAALTAWLHRTAHNIALTALRAGQRRERAEAAARPCTTGSPLDDLSSRELLGILDAELQRLPEKLRLPLILCCLEGRSQDEAARLLGWTAGAVKGRLERGRQQLNQARAGRKEASKANFQRAVNLVTGDPKPGPGGTSMRNIAVAHALAGDFAAAVQHAKESGDFGRALALVAEVQAELGDFAGARMTADFVKKFRAAPTNATDAFRNIARRQAKAGQTAAVRAWAAQEAGNLRAHLLIGLAEGLLRVQEP